MASTSGRVHDIDVATVKQWLDRDEAVLVDVRELFEHAAERIPGSASHALSGFDAALLPETGGKRIVLYCNSGNRSRAAAKKCLLAGAEEVFHLEGGILAWRQAGQPLDKPRKAPIDLMRQVQITAGSLVVIGVILALLVTPWAIALSAFVGVGLAFAGISGFCGMARLLAVMPWNKRAARAGASATAASDLQAA